MTPTPPSASSSRDSPDAFRVVRKRNRIPLSCGPCRHRKLKCNRQSPCDNCTKRGDSASCAYAAPVSRKKNNANAANATPDDMQNRIDRLEGLVLSLMTSGSQAPGSAAAQQDASTHSGSIGSGSLGPNLDSTLDDSQFMDTQSDRGEDESETDGMTKSMGVLKVDAGQQKTVYLGESHWAALLNEISEVKNYFSLHKKEFEAQLEKVTESRKAQGHIDVSTGSALLFGAATPPSRGEILAALPSKYTCDILVGRYFNTFDGATHILHGPVFQRQYNNHWADPSKTSIVWIGMLFSMLRLAMISYGREGDEPPEFRGKCHDMAANYRNQMSHCLVTADYTKPHSFVIETLIFHLHAEFTSNRDAEASIWVLSGMITRLAMRMGYHRDSKLFPNITPFQGEMRRRVWTFVRSADLLFSFQLALPALIRIGDSDTELPRNIYDDDFDEDSKELPAARPASETTPISYLIAKGRLSLGFGRVLEEINGVSRHGYDEILKIDKGLQDIYQSIPEHLKLRPMTEQQMAPLTMIMARFNLATLYHKSQCVLHRRFLRLAKGNNKYMHSRRTCIDSALQLLNFQSIQHDNSQERGRLRFVKQHHVNSLSSHDFLLAASVLCMDVYNHRERVESDISTPNTSVSGGSGSHGSSISGGSAGGDGMYISGLPYTPEECIKALEKSRNIWYSYRDHSIEAYKASELLNLLLYHINMPSSPSQAKTNLPMASDPSNNNDEQTAAMTLGMLQSGAMTPGTSQAAAAAQLAQQSLGWDVNNRGGNSNPMMNAFLGNQNDTSQGVSTPGMFGGGNTAMFPDSFFSNNGTIDVNMNFDWDTWDQYMQPTNLSLDPAANLWNTGSSDTNNIFAQQQKQTPSTDSIYSTNPRTSMSGNDLTFGMQSSYFSTGPSGQRIGADLPKNEMLPNITEGTSTGVGTGTGAEAGNKNPGTGGETFMGASTPGGWKWPTNSDQNR